VDFLPFIERQRATIAHFARGVLDEADYRQMLEEIAVIFSKDINLPASDGLVPRDWMKSNDFLPTDHEFRKLIGGAISINGYAFAALESGNHHAAVTFMLMAERFLGQAERAYRGPKISAKKGGSANRSRFEPLMQYAVDLANQGDYPSRRQASLGILKRVVDEAKRLGITLTLDEGNAQKTIDGWLKKKAYVARPRTQRSGSLGT
jgi:hypothetical protein